MTSRQGSDGDGGRADVIGGALAAFPIVLVVVVSINSSIDDRLIVLRRTSAGFPLKGFADRRARDRKWTESSESVASLY